MDAKHTVAIRKGGEYYILRFNRDTQYDAGIALLRWALNDELTFSRDDAVSFAIHISNMPLHEIEEAADAMDQPEARPLWPQALAWAVACVCLWLLFSA